MLNPETKEGEEDKVRKRKKGERKRRKKENE